MNRMLWRWLRPCRPRSSPPTYSRRQGTPTTAFKSDRTPTSNRPIRPGAGLSSRGSRPSSSADGLPDLSAPPMTFSRPVRLTCAVLSGFALACAFPAYDFPILGWLSVAGLMLASLGARPRQAALGGFLYGAAFYFTTVPWIY